MHMKQVNKFLRIFLIFFFVGLFVYQTMVAIFKYFESPTIVITSSIQASQQTRPRIIVCQKEFVYAPYGVGMGYMYKLHVILGQLTGNDKILSWTSKYDNETWDEVKRKVHDAPAYASVDNLLDWLSSDLKMKTLNILHNKLECGELEVNFTSKRITLASNKGVCIYFVDPYSPHWLNDYSYYAIESSIMKRRSDKTGCVNYETSTDYADCIEKVVTDKLIKVLGCIPPWLETKLDRDYKICTTIERNKTRDDLLWKLYDDTMYMGDVELEGDTCKPHCIETYFEVKKRSDEKINASGSFVMLEFQDKVQYDEEVSSYDGFSLTVEIGSSLGLWIGLSALAIYDFFIIATLQIKSLYSKK